LDVSRSHDQLDSADGNVIESNKITRYSDTPPKLDRPFKKIVKIVILLKKSFSENQKKIFRTQMPYNERSDLG